MAVRRLTPDHKTIADFRKDNGPAIKKVCARFVELCREMGLLTTASVAIDGSKFKAVNNRDKNFTQGESGAPAQAIGGERGALSRPARHGRLQEPSETITLTKTRLKEKLAKLDEEMNGWRRSRNRCSPRPIGRSRLPIPTAARWRRAAAAPASSATTCRLRSIPRTI